MSSKILKVVAFLAVVSIFFSAFGFYLILDTVNVREQLHRQEEQLNELQDALAQLDELQSALEQLDAQEEQLNELRNSLGQLDEQLEPLNEQQEQLNELQDALAQLDELQTALEQLSTQQGQLSNLQTALDETQTSIQETKTSLSNLSNQLNALEQSTSTEIAELGTTVENLEGLISNLSDLEGIVDQLINTPLEVYDAAYKSVVVIRTPIGQGSGFLYNTPNIIVTNYHVVEDETDIEIEFYNRTRTQATVIGSDAYSDIAVLSIPTAPAEAKPLDFGDQPSIGQQVVAIGNPLGLTDSLSVGYISQVNQLLDIEPIIVPVLQLDLTIAPGSSGGPLLDMSGKVVGITNAGTDVGFNFAVPVNIMERVVTSILEEGEYIHPIVGISIVELTPEVISSLNILNVNQYQTGLLVTDVVSGLPADQAGINPAITGTQGITAVDIILAVDERPTYTINDWSAYMEVEVSPGQSITLSLWRLGLTESIDVTTTERPAYEG